MILSFQECRILLRNKDASMKQNCSELQNCIRLLLLAFMGQIIKSESMQVTPECAYIPIQFKCKSSFSMSRYSPVHTSVPVPVYALPDLLSLTYPLFLGG